MIRIVFFILLCLLFAGCSDRAPVDLASLQQQAAAGDSKASRKLVELLGMEENDVGAKVYPMVIETGQPMVGPLLENVKTADREQRERVIAALGTLRVIEAVQPISEVLADKSLKRRYIAAWALGEIGNNNGIDPLLKALGDTDISVRQYATRSLIKFNRRAVEPLIAFLDSAEPLAAAGAIRALGDIGDKRALDALLLQVEGQNRKDAFLALGKLRDPRAESALLLGLDDTDWQVRMNAAMALGTVGSENAAAKLNQTLDDQVMVVREWSARSLSVISGKTVLYRDADGKMVEPYSVYH